MDWTVGHTFDTETPIDSHLIYFVDDEQIIDKSFWQVKMFAISEWPVFLMQYYGALSNTSNLQSVTFTNFEQKEFEFRS